MKFLFLGAVVSVFFAAFWANREGDLHISARSDIAKIVEDARFDKQLLPVWRRALEHIEDEFNLVPIRVNQPYHHGSINVYFFDTRNIGDLSVAGRSAKGNFVTINPDIIFADEEFVKLFVDEYHYYRGALLQIWDQNEQFADSDIRRTLIGSAMLRYGNIDSYYDNPSSLEDGLFSNIMATEFERYSTYQNADQFLEEELKVVLSDPLLWRFTSYLEVAHINRSGGNLSSSFEDVISGLVAQSISFPFLHEIGHIYQRTDGGFFDVNGAQKIEAEQDADSYAITALSDVSNSDWAVGAEFSATLLQQIVFARTLQVDFMDAQKLGHFIQYKDDDCTGSVRGFFDFNLIADIVPSTLPLLTQAEYDLFRSRISAFYSSSHGFLLNRGAAIEALAVPSELSIFDVTYSAYKQQRRNYLSSISTGNVDNLESTQRKHFKEIFGSLSGLPEMHFDFSSFTNEQRQSSVWCPFDDCMIISDDELSVRFEEMRDGDGIVFARLMLRDLFPRDNDAAILLKNDPKVEANSNSRFSILLRFLDKTTTISYNDLLSHMRDLINCRFTSFERDEGTHLVRFSTIGNWYEIQIEMIAKS
ncbi:hypothetical protein [Sulfitobacter pontiacus]|uniref:hypothetical protein n=1 Tax=Sulfitobacter pontiacus TaxID=60137 RepID=UPI00315A8868